MNYVSRAGRLFHAPLGIPAVPAGLRGSVATVAGLSGRFTRHADDVVGGGLSPTTARTAYHISPLYQQGITGQGKRITPISFAQFKQYDLDGFAQQYSLPPYTPVN